MFGNGLVYLENIIREISLLGGQLENFKDYLLCVTLLLKLFISSIGILAICVLAILLPLSYIYSIIEGYKLKIIVHRAIFICLTIGFAFFTKYYKISNSEEDITFTFFLTAFSTIAVMSINILIESIDIDYYNKLSKMDFFFINSLMMIGIIPFFLSKLYIKGTILILIIIGFELYLFKNKTIYIHSIKFFNNLKIIDENQLDSIIDIKVIRLLNKKDGYRERFLSCLNENKTINVRIKFTVIVESKYKLTGDYALYDINNEENLYKLNSLDTSSRSILCDL